MTGTFEFGENSIEEFEFAARAPKEIIADTVRIHRVLDLFKDKRMITDLLQLHHRVIQSPESFPNC